MNYETDEIDEIDECQNYENNGSQNNGRNDYYENNGCWNNEIDVYQNNGMYDSVNYENNVFQNNGRNEFLNWSQNPPILNNGLVLLGKPCHLLQSHQMCNSIIIQTFEMVSKLICRSPFPLFFRFLSFYLSQQKKDRE